MRERVFPFPRSHFFMFLLLVCFQEDKIFAREESQLAEQLEESKQKEFGQKYRVEKLTQEEIEMIKTEEFIKAKKEYMKEVR